jgi:DNA repair protein RadC
LAEIGRDGHRSRMRQAYLSGNMDNAPDHNLLELYLSIIIPRKDVKQLSYDLINHFGSLEAVFEATPQSLMAINGVGESTAVAISLVHEINKKIRVNKNNNIEKIKSLDELFLYCKNLLINETNEVVYIVTLNNSFSVINKYKVGSGTVNSTNVDTKMIISNSIKDNASYVLMTHNHPNGSAHPSGEDINFTVRIKDILETFGIRFFDHIIVGENDLISLRRSKDYNISFDRCI